MLNFFRLIQPYLLALTFFAIPVSVSLKSLFLPLCIAVNLLCLSDWRKILLFFKHPVVITALLLMTWCFISAWWAPTNWALTDSVNSKMAKLAYLPFLAIGFVHHQARQLAKVAFLGAVSLTATISLSMAISGQLWTGAIDAGTVFNDRIMTGLFISVGAWLAADMAMKANHSQKWVCWGVFFLCSAQIFIANTGRTGYVLYLLLATGFCLMHLTIRQGFAFFLALSVAAVSSYCLNASLAKTVDLTIYNLFHLQQMANSSSIGYRIGFHHFAQSLFWEHPIFGSGSGSFSWYFHQRQPMPFYSDHLFEPHSQYWLTLVEQGFIGFGLLMLWLGTLGKMILDIKQTRAWLFLVFTAILATNLSDSMILYSATGYLLLAVTAVGLGEWIEQNSLSLTVVPESRSPATWAPL